MAQIDRSNVATRISHDLELLQNILSSKISDKVAAKLSILQSNLLSFNSNSNFDDISDTDFSILLTLLDDIKEYTSPDFLFHIAEEEWIGAVPPELQLTSIPYQVMYGAGGWDCCKQSFHVRGKSYLYDNVKISSHPPLFHVRGVQMFKVPVLRSHIATERWTAFTLQHKPHEEWFIQNFMVPGNPPMQMVVYSTASKLARDTLRGKVDIEVGSEHEGWQNSLRRFWLAQKDYCDSHFKLIPNVVQGPWAVKMAVGSKPALIGNKLQLHYSRGPGYFEVDIDIGSSSVASRILSMVRDVCSSLTVDVGITLEGVTDDELPERILSFIQWKGVNFKLAENLSP